MLMNRRGTVTDTLPAVPYGAGRWSITNPDVPPERAAGIFQEQPFADGPLWGFVYGERATIVLDRQAPRGGERAEFRVSKLTFRGDTIFTRAYPFEPVPLEGDEVDRVLDEVVPRVVEIWGVTPARARRWAERGFYRPDFRPAVRELKLGRDGSIWLHRGSDGPGSGSRSGVFGCPWIFSCSS